MRLIYLLRLVGLWIIVMIIGHHTVGIIAQDIIHEVQLDETSYHIAWSPDDTLLAVATDSGVRVFTADMQEITTLHVGRTVRIAWHPDSTFLAAIQDDLVYIWQRDIQTNVFSQVITLPPVDPIYTTGVRSLAWSPNGSHLAVMYLYQPENFFGVLGVTEIINTVTWQNSDTLAGEWIFPSRDIQWQPGVNQELIATAHYTCDTPDSIRACNNLPTFFVQNVETDEILWTEEDFNVTYDVSWSPDGQRLVVGASNLYLYDPYTGQRLAEWDIDGVNTVIALYSDWTVDGRFIVVVNELGNGGVIELASQQIVSSFTLPRNIGEYIRSVDLNGSNELAVLTGNGTIRVVSIPV